MQGSTSVPELEQDIQAIVCLQALAYSLAQAGVYHHDHSLGIVRVGTAVFW